jgi:asparagine synthetase B (glutamine-hydrolysing)
MDQPPSLTGDSRAVLELHSHLIESLSLRILGVPVPPNATESDASVAVLFSGGLDCSMLARIASDILPPSYPIDLINVAFENPRIASQHKGRSRDELYEMCPDRVTGRKSFCELAKVCPQRRWRLVTVRLSYIALD